ncbi:MAG: MBL fold metallo-hydrolase [Clostridiales bacterium]|nr:MBL fold metallo-hydrolase [Clostridiales bacterium]
MQIKIHRGTHQIGGCVTEIKTAKARIIIDMGEELPTNQGQTPLEIDGVTKGTPDCNGVLITHYHGDHVGMFEKVLPQIPIYMGKVAKQIYAVVQNTLKAKLNKGNPIKVQSFNEYTIGKPLYFGDIKVTPYTIDHSAFDAYMLLIEAEGKRILHTGDFRMHGARGNKMPAVLEKYCKNIDVLITEGTMLSRINEQVFTEHELGLKAEQLMQKNKYIFAICSSTNIDTIAEFYNAALKNNKPFIVCEKDFQAEILKIVTHNSSSQFYNFDRRKVYSYGENLNKFMTERGFFFLGRANNTTQKAIQAFPDSLLIYSMWSGYLNEKHPAFDKYKSDFINNAISNGCRVINLHTSGHASIDEIIKICEITGAKTIIPIHSENPEMLKELGVSGNIIVLQDNEIFSIKQI